MGKLALWEERLPKPIRHALDLGTKVVGVKGLAMLWALGLGMLPSIAVVLAGWPLSATILAGTSAFLLGTASVGQTIAWWKRRHHLKVAWEERQLRRLAVNSVAELVDTIDAYIRHRNQDPKPFVWTKSAKTIIEKIERGLRTLEAVH